MTKPPREGNLHLPRRNPAPVLRTVAARVDNVLGDHNLVCSCVGMEAYSA